MLHVKLPSQFESCRVVAKPFVMSKGVKMGLKSRPCTLCFKNKLPNSVRVNVKWMYLVLILQSVVISQEYERKMHVKAMASNVQHPTRVTATNCSLFLRVSLGVRNFLFYFFSLSGFIWHLNQGYPTSVGPDTHQVAVKMTPYRHKCSFMLPKMCQ